MTKEEFNELLRDAIIDRNINEVTRLLKLGADPNYQLPEETYKETGEYKAQPYSPLRLVIFIISDSLIGDEELAKDARIAALLLEYGADAKSALQLAEDRYGKYDPKMEITPFSKVIRIVKDAEKHQRIANINKNH